MKIIWKKVQSTQKLKNFQFSRKICWILKIFFFSPSFKLFSTEFTSADYLTFWWAPQKKKYEHALLLLLHVPFTRIVNFFFVFIIGLFESSSLLLLLLLLWFREPDNKVIEFWYVFFYFAFFVNNIYPRRWRVNFFPSFAQFISSESYLTRPVFWHILRFMVFEIKDLLFIFFFFTWARGICYPNIYHYYFFLWTTCRMTIDKSKDFANF